MRYHPPSTDKFFKAILKNCPGNNWYIKILNTKLSSIGPIYADMLPKR